MAQFIEVIKSFFIVSAVCIFSVQGVAVRSFDQCRGIPCVASYQALLLPWFVPGIRPCPGSSQAFTVHCSVHVSDTLIVHVEAAVAVLILIASVVEEVFIMPSHILILRSC